MEASATTHARQEMSSRLAKWRKAGFHFKLEWLLRCINAVVTGQARFSALAHVDTARFRQGLHQAEKSIDTLLNLISSRLGLDHDRVLGSRYSFPLMSKYLVGMGGSLGDHQERDRLLYWYIHTLLWGRYSGSTESVLGQDLDVVADSSDPLERLIDRLRQNRDLQISPKDFLGWSRGARFYPLLYLLTRVHHSRDWDTGVELSSSLLGHLNKLQVHHIFPKALLYKNGYSLSEVNATANLTFLTQETNLKVSSRNPAEYLEEFTRKHPGAVESHWIPMDPNLWKVDNYRDFLEARRELLAAAANDFLDSLLEGALPEAQATNWVLGQESAVPDGFEDEEEDRLIREVNKWVVQQGLPEGEFTYELADWTSEEPLAVIDLAWPNGLQEGYSQPVALLLNEDHDTEQAVNQAGYLFFTNVDALKGYVQQKVLGSELIGA